MIRSVIFALFCTIFLHCESKNQKNSKYEQFIQGIPALDYQIKTVDFQNSDLYSFNRVFIDSARNLIVADFKTWTIYLFDKDGNLLSKFGKEGRGPGEFLGMHKINVHEDSNTIQIYDGKLNRITILEVKNDSLLYLESNSIQGYERGYFLKDFYTVNDKSFGLFQLSNAILDIDENGTLQLNAIDSNLMVSDSLFSFRGDEQVEMDFNGNVFSTSIPFGFSTEWMFKDSTLVISNSENMDFTIYNLLTGDQKIYSINEIPEITNGNYVLEYFRDNYIEMLGFNENFEKNLLEREKMPFFINFGVTNHNIVVSMSSYSSDSKVILVLDKKSNKLEKLEVPNNFYMHGVVDNILFGKQANRESGIDFVSVIEF
jgi:hypothetical protein